jgi:hypothetical protein
MGIEYVPYMKAMEANNWQIWLRIDVDTMLGVSIIPAMREFCQARWPGIKRRWYIRHNTLPPVETLKGETVGLHITEPKKADVEYGIVSEHFGGEKLYSYTRHGSGVFWDDEKEYGPTRPGTDVKYVTDHLPWMTDLGKQTPHHTIDRVEDPAKLKWEGLWDGKWSVGHVLFHPEYLGTERGRHLVEILETVRRINQDRLSGKRKVI